MDLRNSFQISFLFEFLCLLYLKNDFLQGGVCDKPTMNFVSFPICRAEENCKVKHSFLSLRDVKRDVDDICHGREKNGKISDEVDRDRHCRPCPKSFPRIQNKNDRLPEISSARCCGLWQIPSMNQKNLSLFRRSAFDFPAIQYRVRFPTTGESVWTRRFFPGSERRKT